MRGYHHSKDLGLETLKGLLKGEVGVVVVGGEEGSLVVVGDNGGLVWEGVWSDVVWSVVVVVVEEVEEGVVLEGIVFDEVNVLIHFDCCCCSYCCSCGCCCGCSYCRLNC